MEHKFPQIKPHPFSKVFRPRTDQSAITLISLLLEYTPTARLSAPQALVNEFFDELRVEGVKLPNGHDMPALFNFTKEGESFFSIFCEDGARCGIGRSGTNDRGKQAAEKEREKKKENRKRTKNKADFQNYQPDLTSSESLYPHTPSPHFERTESSWTASSLFHWSKCASASIKFPKPNIMYIVPYPIHPTTPPLSLYYTIFKHIGFT
jgi:hypothetical protein